MHIGIIGHFGSKESFYDGQTVKTITLYNSLVGRCPQNVQIYKVDTYYVKNNPIKFCFQFISCIIKNQKIIVLLSKNGRKVLFPILYILSKTFKKKIYHDCIGGQLANEVEKIAYWRKYVSSFQINWVESRGIVNKLLSLGISNVVYLPNYKNLKVLEENKLNRHYEKPYRFVTFSRVMPEKGIEDAINAIVYINSKAGKTVVKLDIYGIIEKGYEERFSECLERAGTNCTYCGVTPADNSVDVLKKYYLLLFPTYWKGEGMPGTVIDSYCAGIPVIARYWSFCDEIIDHGITGYIYDFDKPEKLVDWIEYAIQNPNEIIGMKKNCLHKACEYTEEHAINQIIEQMNIANLE